MALGVSSYTWTWAVGIKGYMPKNPLSAQDLIKKAKSLGVNILQIADNPVLHEMSNNELNNIYLKAQEYGIRLEIGTRGIGTKHLLRYLEIAKKLHSKIVRTITHKIDREAVCTIKEVIPKYKDAGISIAFENHDEHTSPELAGFLDRIGSKYVGVCLDTVNSFAALEPPKFVIEELTPYILNLHIKDFDIVRVDHQLGFSVEGRPAGEGRLDIPWLINYLREKKKDPNVILELWTPFSRTIQNTIRKEEEWAIRSVKYLKNIIK